MRAVFRQLHDDRIVNAKNVIFEEMATSSYIRYRLNLLNQPVSRIRSMTETQLYHLSWKAAGVKELTEE